MKSMSLFQGVVHTRAKENQSLSTTFTTRLDSSPHVLYFGPLPSPLGVLLGVGGWCEGILNVDITVLFRCSHIFRLRIPR